MLLTDGAQYITGSPGRGRQSINIVSDAKNLLLKLYSLKIHSVQEVLDRLAFMVPDAAFGAFKAQRTLIVALFQARVRRWLVGIGHPERYRGGLVEEEVWEKEKDDPLIRAKLLVLTMAGLRYMPVDPGILLVVCHYIHSPLKLVLMVLICSLRYDQEGSLALAGKVGLAQPTSMYVTTVPRLRWTDG